MKFTLTSGTHKSLAAPLVWDSIPEFAVITGPNGSGKTQLLNLISSVARSDQTVAPTATTSLTGIDIDAAEVAHMGSWGLSNAQISPPGAVGKLVTQAVEYLRGNNPSPRPAPNERLEAMRAAVEEKLGKPAGKADPAEVAAALPIGAVLQTWAIGTLPNQISSVFHNHWIARVQLKAEGRSEKETDLEVGVRPWKVLNDLLATSGVGYRLTTPEGLDIRFPFTLALEDRSRGVTVGFGELSSGETALVSLYLWLYTSREHALLPRLVLLDEPDAHLHPGLTRGFLHALHGVLVKQHQCRVIMTTHRPDTVAVAPAEALFEMFRDGTRIRPVTSKEQTLGRLCANVFTVIPGIRTVLVEGNDDIDFYNAALRLAHDVEVLPAEVTPIFVSASTGKGEVTISGGKTQVSAWVAKLQGAGLGKLIQGIVDRDSDPVSATHIHTLERYSFENFLVDPIVVFAALLDAGQAPALPTLDSQRKGQEALLGRLAAADLQEISDVIIAAMEVEISGLSDEEKARVDVTFVSGQQLTYPRWLMNRKGKDLLQRFHGRYGSAITRKLLLSAFERVRMVPNDLAETYRRLV